MCSADYDETTEKAVIIVKSEFTDAELLRCEIRAQDVYQRQQGEQGDLGRMFRSTPYFPSSSCSLCRNTHCLD